MARIRTLKPEFWTDEDLSSLSAETHILAAAILNQADDEGYFNANPKLIQAAVFPLRELSSTIPVMLQELSGIKYLRLFHGSDGKSYGCILNFVKHQVISHSKPSKIRLLEDSSNVPVPFQKITAGKEGKGKEGNGIPPDLSAMEYARSLIEELGLPATGLIQIVAESIEANAKDGTTLVQSYQAILKRALEDRADGKKINRFWFSDGAYLTAAPEQPKKVVYLTQRPVEEDD